MTGNPARLAATAQAYDAVAVRYAGFVRAAPAVPLERAVLGAFAECVTAAGGGLVADLGCGPGLMTARLRDLGLDVFGVDLSTSMIGLARGAYPGLRFEAGSMDALDLADGALAGIVSWYSVIHAAPEELPGYFAEIGRMSREPGADERFRRGHLLLRRG